MVYRGLSDFIVLIHFGFVFFSVIGGFLVFKWKRIIWIHLPAVFWVIWIEVTGWICPLTPLENWFRLKSGTTGYQTGFIEHYILSLLYPDKLTRSFQIVLGISVLVVNMGIYGWMLRVQRKRRTVLGK
jgi:hypothetical protein